MHSNISNQNITNNHLSKATFLINFVNLAFSRKGNLLRITFDFLNVKEKIFHLITLIETDRHLPKSTIDTELGYL